MLACSLVHSHIKSNSFIFTFVHPSRAGRAGWAGLGLTEGLLWQRAGGSLGEVRRGRTLGQRVSYLVLRAPAQEFSFLIRAGQGVAAAVTTHVECGVHGVGEVGGLQGDRGFRWGSGAGLYDPDTAPRPHPISQPYTLSHPIHGLLSLPWKPLPLSSQPTLSGSKAKSASSRPPTSSGSPLSYIL